MSDLNLGMEVGLDGGHPVGHGVLFEGEGGREGGRVKQPTETYRNGPFHSSCSRAAIQGRREGGREGRNKRPKRTEIDPSTDFSRSSTVPSTLLYSSCSRAAMRFSETSSWDWILRMVLEMWS